MLSGNNTRLTGVQAYPSKGCQPSQTPPEDEVVEDLALLCFCDQYDIELVEVEVHGVNWPWQSLKEDLKLPLVGDAALQGSTNAVLWFGGNGRAVIKQGLLHNNTISSVLRLSGNTTVALTQGTRVWGNLQGRFGAGVLAGEHTAVRWQLE